METSGRGLRGPCLESLGGHHTPRPGSPAVHLTWPGIFRAHDLLRQVLLGRTDKMPDHYLNFEFCSKSRKSCPQDPASPLLVERGAFPPKRSRSLPFSQPCYCFNTALSSHPGFPGWESDSPPGCSPSLSCSCFPWLKPLRRQE